jgi:hypothetical protein
MQISVFQGEALIGTAIIEHLDPPMGVAFGPFVPSDQYDRNQHADVLDGNYIGDKGHSFLARANQHGLLKTNTITIEDWSDPKIGMQLTVWFRDGGDFAALFSEHADYKTYYAR